MFDAGSNTRPQAAAAVVEACGHVGRAPAICATGGSWKTLCSPAGGVSVKGLSYSPMFRFELLADEGCGLDCPVVTLTSSVSDGCAAGNGGDGGEGVSFVADAVDSAARRKRRPLVWTHGWSDWDWMDYYTALHACEGSAVKVDDSSEGAEELSSSGIKKRKHVRLNTFRQFLSAMMLLLVFFCFFYPAQLLRSKVQGDAARGREADVSPSSFLAQLLNDPDLCKPLYDVFSMPELHDPDVCFGERLPPSCCGVVLRPRPKSLLCELADVRLQLVSLLTPEDFDSIFGDGFLPGACASPCLDVLDAWMDYGDGDEVTCCVSAVDELMPHGPAAVVPDARFERTEHGWIIGNHPMFDSGQVQQLKDMLVSVKPCFAYSLNDLPGYHGACGEFTIPLKDDCKDKVIWTKQRKHSEPELAFMDQKCGEMLSAGIIQPSKQTKYASEVVVALKKNEITGEWTDKRCCQDFRQVNECMQVDRYRLPLADEIFDAIGDCCVFSKIDARSGFWQIPIRQEDRALTAFWWRGKLFEFTRMPFGLHNSPQRWQAIMDMELSGCSSFARAFVDDILVFSRTPEEHVEHVRKVLETLNAVGIKAHPDKCLFGCDVVEYLGFNVSRYGLTPHQAKVAAIAALKVPTCVSDVRSVLGLMSYYRRFVPNFSEKADALNKLLGKGVPFEWGEEQQAAFDELKAALTTEGRALKRVDPALPLLVYCDWSQKGIGAVLAQVDSEGQEHLCACISRSLNKHERNYVSFKGELLACVWACQVFRHYLHGRQFTVITDHQPLLWLVSNKNLVGQYARWAMIMSEYEFTIVHRKGSSHINADTLSRMPRDSDVDVTGARLDVEASSSTQLEPLTEPATPAEVLCHWISAEPCEFNSCDYDVLARAPGITPLSCCAVSSDAHLLRTAAAASLSVQVLNHAQSVMPTSAMSAIPDSAALLCGNVGSIADDRGVMVEAGVNSIVGTGRINSLRARALSWLTAAGAELRTAAVDSSKYQVWKPACVVTKRDKHYAAKRDNHGVLHTACIDTHVVADQFFSEALTGGVVVLELFGGLCAGLEMLLRNGIKVKKYMYCDKDSTARRVAAHRLHLLSSQYPALLPPESFYYAFTSFAEQDVWRVTTDELVQAGALSGDQWIIVAGWECQDLSPAGSWQRHSW